MATKPQKIANNKWVTGIYFTPNSVEGKFHPIYHGVGLFGACSELLGCLRQETFPKVAHLAGEPSSLTPKVSLSGYRPGGLTHGVNGNPPVVFVWSKHRGKKKLRTVIFHFCKTGLKPFVSFFKDGVVVKKGA